MAGDYAIEVFYDGDCPLCMREIRMLMGRDKDSNIRFTDIAGADFAASDYGMSHNDFMARIKGRTESGQWIDGPEVFRRLYAAVGFERLARWSRAPGVSQLMDLGYSVFAKNRLRWTGRCEDEVCAVPESKAR